MAVKRKIPGIVRVEHFYTLLIACIVGAAGLRVNTIACNMQSANMFWRFINNALTRLAGVGSSANSLKAVFLCGIVFLGFVVVSFFAYIFPTFIPRKNKTYPDPSLLGRRPPALVRMIILLIVAVIYCVLGAVYGEKAVVLSGTMCVLTVICGFALILVIRDVYMKRNSEDYVFFERRKKVVLLKATALGICLAGLPLWIPNFWGFTIPQPLALEQKDLLELYIAVLSLTFVSISVMSMLSDRSIVIYWENIAIRKLIKPVFCSFAAYTYYSVGAALGAGISVATGNTSVFLVFCVINIGTLVLLTYTMVDVYYDRDGKKTRMVKELQEDARDYEWILEDERLANDKRREKEHAEHRMNKAAKRPYTPWEIRDKKIGCQRYKEKIMLLRQNFARSCEEHDVLYLREVYELYIQNPECFHNPDGERIVQMLFAEITADTRPLLIDALETLIDKLEANQSRTKDPFAPYCNQWEEDFPLWSDFTKSQYLCDWFRSAGKDSVSAIDLHNFIIQVVRRIVVMYNDMVTHANIKCDGKPYDYLKLSVFYSYLTIKTEADERPKPAQVAEVFDVAFGKMIPESMFPSTLMLMLGFLLENLEESERDKLHSLFYDFPLPYAFTPYQHCIFQDEKSPAAVLWATLFPQEEA